jgi:hypothetical protein
MGSLKAMPSGGWRSSFARVAFRSSIGARRRSRPSSSSSSKAPRTTSSLVRRCSKGSRSIQRKNCRFGGTNRAKAYPFARSFAASEKYHYRKQTSIMSAFGAKRT